MELEPEIWLPIKGWEGKYYISSHGRFKSIGGKYKLKHPDGYITYGHKDTQGYKAISFRRPGTHFCTRVHIVVCEHFHGPKPIWSTCVNHKDGDKWNNYYKNLEWSDDLANIQHAVAIGLMDLKGEKHPSVKLTKEKVIQMRMLRKTGLTHEKIAEMFGVCRRQAGDVINGVNWGWLKEGL